jgi:hypothetical protein
MPLGADIPPHAEYLFLEIPLPERDRYWVIPESMARCVFRQMVGVFLQLYSNVGKLRFEYRRDDLEERLLSACAAKLMITNENSNTAFIVD